MKIWLVFHDWVKGEESVYHTRLGAELTMGDFHNGTVFRGKIEIPDYMGEFAMAAEAGIVPVFYVLEIDE